MVLAWASVNEGPSTSSRFTSVHVVLMLVYTHIHCHEVLDFLHLTEVLPNLQFAICNEFLNPEPPAPTMSHGSQPPTGRNTKSEIPNTKQIQKTKRKTSK